MIVVCKVVCNIYSSWRWGFVLVALNGFADLSVYTVGETLDLDFSHDARALAWLWVWFGDWEDGLDFIMIILWYRLCLSTTSDDVTVYSTGRLTSNRLSEVSEVSSAGFKLISLSLRSSPSPHSSKSQRSVGHTWQLLIPWFHGFPDFVHTCRVIK